MTLLAPHHLDLDRDEPFARYCREITAFCPYLKPAIDAKVSFVRHLQITGRTLDECHARLFEAAVPVIEALRAQRRATTNRAHALLLNENLVLEFPPEFDDLGKELFAWPVFALKHLYTDKSLLFGMFWKGEVDVARSGAPLPIPPVHFLSIRSAVKARAIDQRFFSANPHLLQPHIEACDDEADVLGPACEGLAHANDPATLRSLDAYVKILSWLKEGGSAHLSRQS